MMREIWKSTSYSPSEVTAHYVCASIDGSYRLYEVGPHGLTLREWDVDRAELPRCIAEACDALRGFWPNCFRLEDPAAIRDLWMEMGATDDAAVSDTAEAAE